jgi:integrase
MLVQTNAVPDIVLVDPVRLLPRYWATVWSLSMKGRSLSRNTHRLQLRHIGAFYQFCDHQFGLDALDSAIGERDAETFQDMVERFHIALTSDRDYTTTTAQRWAAVRGFAKVTARRLAPKSDAWRALSSLLDGMSAIRPPRRGRFRFVRALPATTLEDLLAIAEPRSPRNPFLGEQTQLRNWLIVNLLLLCGLRRGEALLLSIDALKQDVDPDTGELAHWLDVTTTDEEDDRSTRPSLKTDQSHRQIPVSSSLAELYELYVNNARAPSDEHAFLLTARNGEPLSAESVNKLMRQLTAALLPGALQRFRERAGGKANVSPHDLRHTCATARYTMFMAAEPNRELTLQRMRAFFGWSLTSEMPELYARSAIQDDLLRSWKHLFDDRIRMLRSLEH